jgi:hypothetical protein
MPAELVDVSANVIVEVGGYLGIIFLLHRKADHDSGKAGVQRL